MIATLNFNMENFLLVSRKVEVKKFLTCEKITSRIQKNSNIAYQSMQTFQRINFFRNENE